jgi:DNA-binding NarL/FixJ family response regulator
MKGERSLYLATPSELTAAIAQATRRSCVLRAHRSGRPRWRREQVQPAALTRQLSAAEPVDGQLSRREVEVVHLVMAGMTNREIAQKLFIAERTAEGHLERIRGKLGVRSRTEVAIWAARRGIGENR